MYIYINPEVYFVSFKFNLSIYYIAVGPLEQILGKLSHLSIKLWSKETQKKTQFLKICFSLKEFRQILIYMYIDIYRYIDRNVAINT